MCDCKHDYVRVISVDGKEKSKICRKCGDKLKKEQSKLSYSISVRDMDVFKMMLEYTQALLYILEEYPLSEEDEKKLNSISKDFFSLKREVES